jgi:hypothetical protein
VSDPSYALQVAMVTALKADNALAAFVGVRIYDDPPASATFPYVQVGEGQVVGDDTEDCGDGSEVFIRTHAWSRAAGFPEVKRIAAEVRRVLKVAPSLSGFDVTVVEFVQSQFLRDPDGLTRHAVVEHRYLITHTS